MQLQIDTAQLQDAPQLANLLAQLGYPASVQQVADRIIAHQAAGYHLLVAKEGSYTLGFISLHIYQAMHHTQSIGRITAFCIDESIRGTGAGSQLLTAAEMYFQSNNCFKVEVTSNLKRDTTHAYYLKRGYREVSKHFIKLLSPKG